MVRAIGTIPIGMDRGDNAQVSAVAIAISVKSLVLFFMKIILALFFQYNKVKIGNI